MPLPGRLQTKKENYTTILASRYPPNTPSWKLSAGYARSSDAELDTTPVTTVYSLDDFRPTNTSTLFTDSAKTSLFNGSSQWFHLFDSGGSSLNTTLQITTKGVVVNRTTF
jgi:hypothetical protein